MAEDRPVSLLKRQNWRLSQALELQQAKKEGHNQFNQECLK